MEKFLRARHIKFFKLCLNYILPSRYSSLDTSRLTVAFFALSGLDVMGEVDVCLDEGQKKSLVDWIYSLQILPNSTRSNLHNCGFRGSTCNGSLQNDTSHIAMTYTALLSLLILGDDLGRVKKESVLAGLKALQMPNGCFSSTLDGSEDDMRFVYCACVVSFVLDDWSGVDVKKTVRFIKESLSYEGAFAQAPGSEAHGGSTYCAVSSLLLMGRLEEVLSKRQVRRMCEWCLLRQQEGFQGRPNKQIDTCYSFWVGATLKMLHHFHFTNHPSNLTFLLDNQDPIVGGFSKNPGAPSDALHAYFSICGLSLMSFAGLSPLQPELNITRRTAEKLINIHEGIQLLSLNNSIQHLTPT